MGNLNGNSVGNFNGDLNVVIKWGFNVGIFTWGLKCGY